MNTRTQWRCQSCRAKPGAGCGIHGRRSPGLSCAVGPACATVAARDRRVPHAHRNRTRMVRVLMRPHGGRISAALPSARACRSHPTPRRSGPPVPEAGSHCLSPGGVFRQPRHIWSVPVIVALLVSLVMIGSNPRLTSSSPECRGGFSRSFAAAQMRFPVGIAYRSARGHARQTGPELCPGTSRNNGDRLPPASAIGVTFPADWQ